MENDSSSNAKAPQKRRRKVVVTQEEVISKLKDDGDFDNLRLKIIRKLKDNNELRSNIISVVKQSAVLHRPRVENVKPRELSDMIFEDIRDKTMSQISDCAWEIIRSGDGIKGEIVETVQTVYSKLVNPEGIPPEGDLPIHGMVPVNKETDCDGPIRVSIGEASYQLSENDPNEPPGFSFTLSNNHPNGHGESHKEDQPVQRGTEGLSKTVDVPSDVIMSASQDVHEHKEPCDGSDDEDPEVPPGFGCLLGGNQLIRMLHR